MAPPQPRIFMGLAQCSGYLTRLKDGLEALGVPVLLFSTRPDPFGYDPRAHRHGLLRLAERIGARRGRAAREGPWIHLLWCFWLQLIQVVLLAWAIPRFDAFIFSYKASFLAGLWDLALLRWLGKRVLHVYAGSDVRPPYLTGGHWPEPEAFDAPRCAALQRSIKKAVRRIDDFAHESIGLPLYAQNQGRPFLCNTWLGFPLPTSDVPPLPAARPAGAPLRVLHTPSSPVVKGTRHIRLAVEAVRARGVEIDYVEISGRPNAEVLREMSTCDLVIDQAFADAPVTGVCTEAALFGVPSLLAGYAGEEIGRIIPPGTQPPTLFCRPEGLADALERLARDPAERRRIGLAAREYVLANWAPRQVAGRFLRVVRGDIPKEWYFDPATLRYAHGFGLHEEALRARLQALLRYGGKAALGMEDNPDLEARLVALAGRDSLERPSSSG